MNYSLWIGRVITGLISVLQASTLRDRLYTLESRVELLEVAINDIERINANSANPNSLISGICTRVRS